MKIDSEAIRELASLLDETGLTEIEVNDNDKSIRVSKGNMVVASGSAQGGPVQAGSIMPSDPTTPQQASTDAPSVITGEHPGAVTSPMVGTAYMQSEPGAPPFVKKGDKIEQGDTILIIEAMKVMNPIKADRAGIVTQVLIENGQPVEFGDVLIVLE